MINYSIAMRLSDPTDKTSAKRAYPTAQIQGTMDLMEFAEHIANHGSVYSRADITAVLIMAVDCLREQLLEGKKVKLGELGNFSVSLQSKGADTAMEFTSALITAVNVNWEPGIRFTDLREKAEFQQVPTRVAAAATLKAEKAGAATVNIEEAKAKAKSGNTSSDSSDGGTTDASGTDDNTTGSTGSGGNTGGSDDGDGGLYSGD